MTLPLELNRLATNYRNTDKSIQQIHSTLLDLETDEFISELKTDISDITENLDCISRTLESFTDDFNTTNTFFKGIDRSLESVYGVNYKYEYTAFAIRLMVSIAQSMRTRIT